MKIRKGDTVQVISGKDKGKQGTVLQVLPANDDKKKATGDRVIVSGVNTAAKHLKPGRRGKNSRAPQQQDRGGIVDIDMPIDVSNVAYVHNGKPSRVGYEVRDGKKVRVAKVGGGKTEVIG